MNKTASSIITLTTDFGYHDPFIAEMKGVILSIEPSASIVDITHDIEPFNILEAAFVIDSASKYFPPGTIHVVVVDPGVGSERRAVLIEAGEQFYVGPDNGVFSDIIRRLQQFRCYHITNESYMLSRESPTFQGRDLFAPVAANLSKGIHPTEVGPEISDPVLITLPGPYASEDGLIGEIVYIDRFGNAITNITAEDLKPFIGNCKVRIRDHYPALVNHYSESPPDNPACLINSSGRLEIFSYLNNAARLLGIRKADIVDVLRITR